MSNGLNAADASVLDTLATFYEEDVDTLLSLKPNAGKGEDGKYESFFLSMGIYYMENAIAYFKQIANNFNQPVSAVSQDVDVVLLDGHNIKVSEIKEIQPPKKEQKQLPVTTTQKGTTVYSTGTYSSTPLLKEDEVKALIFNILVDIPDEELNRVGFIGWLVAETQSRIVKEGGKSDPKAILRLVMDVKGHWDNAVRDVNVIIGKIVDEEEDDTPTPVLGEVIGEWTVTAWEKATNMVWVKNKSTGSSKRLAYRQLLEDAKEVEFAS